MVGACLYSRGMAGGHEPSRTDARRIAVRAQLLTKERPTGLLETVQQLSLLQLDPTRAIAPRAELVVWSPLGSAYSLHELWDVVDEQRLIELRGTLRVAEDIGLYRAEMAEWPGTSDVRGWKQLQRDWVAVNNACRRDLLERLRTDGPLPARELPDTCVKPWASSGWNNNRNVTMMLDFLVQRGEVAVAGGTGRDRLWDLASRVYTDVPPVPTEEALRLRDERRLGSRHRAIAWSGVPGRAAGRRRGRRAGRGRGGPRPVARRPGAWATYSSSTTPSRCTSRLPSGGGATTPSRSCTATGWSGSSTPGRPQGWGVHRWGGPRGRTVHQGHGRGGRP